MNIHFSYLEKWSVKPDLQGADKHIVKTHPNITSTTCDKESITTTISTTTKSNSNKRGTHLLLRNLDTFLAITLHVRESLSTPHINNIFAARNILVVSFAFFLGIFQPQPHNSRRNTTGKLSFRSLHMRSQPKSSQRKNHHL